MQDENTTKVVFSSRLRVAMDSNGLTQSSVATMLSVSQAAVSKWVRGGIPSGDLLYRLSVVLGVKMEWLLGVEGEAPLESGCKSLTQVREEAELLVRKLRAVEASAERLIHLLTN